MIQRVANEVFIDKRGMFLSKEIEKEFFFSR